MDYLQNHIWCSESCWGAMYDCRHLVSLDSYKPDTGEDWDNLVDEEAEQAHDFRYKEAHEKSHRRMGLPNAGPEYYQRAVANLRPHVLRWLADNVKDRKDPDCVKGWCVGSTQYRMQDTSSITVFFHRRSDAMAFIREFSIWKKPINYCQYFSDVRKKLDTATGKYIIRE